MTQLITDTLVQVLNLLPKSWSEPKITNPDANAISARFEKEKIIITILTNPATKLTTASYLKIGDLPDGIEEHDLDDLIKRINEFLVSLYRIEQL